MAACKHAKNGGELRCTRHCACVPGSQWACKVGSAGTGVAREAGSARFSIRGQWLLNISKALPTETPVTQGAAVQEAIAQSTKDLAGSGPDPPREVGHWDNCMVPLSSSNSCYCSRDRRARQWVLSTTSVLLQGSWPSIEGLAAAG